MGAVQSDDSLAPIPSLTLVLATCHRRSEVDDPLVGREIAWLAEIRQRNFDAGAL